MKRTLLSSLFSITSSLLLAQCFGLTNLNSSSITCTYGNYNNPYMNTGVANNRHTVNTDVNAYDANASQLKVIPEGESVSIRLGNDDTGSEAESITFEYIPNSENPILLLKYAAVMQNPNHTSNEQPRLKMEVMDADGNAIDKDCMSFDFIANESLGWNSITQGGGGYPGRRTTILWKDWTSIGVNMMPYIGKKLRIRLTTYDCAQGGHYGYAYIHLGCQSNKIQSSACGNLTSSTFSAPAGFEYRWYKKQGDIEVVKGTTQSISVPMDGDEYFCDISQIGKPGCSFTLSVVAEPRYALSRFDIKKVSGCVDTIYLTNKSCVSSDGVTPYLPLTDCDEAIWDLGDGRQLTTYQLSTTPITYSKGGTYTISLTAKLAGEGNCMDVHSEEVTVRGADDDHTGHIYETICEGSYYNFGGQRIVQSGEYRKTDKTALGCDSTTVLHLTCKPAFLLEDSVFLCPNEQYDFRGQIVTRSGTYYDRLQSSLGCDSTYRLIVYVRPTALSTDTVRVCRNDSAMLHGRWVSKEGTYVDTLRTRVTGCDSICRTVVRLLPADTTRLTVTICDNEPYTFNGKQYNTTGTYYARHKNADGCDSTVVLTLQVLPTYLQTQYVEVCHDETFEFRGRVLSAPGVYYDSLLTQTGCDSVFKIVFNKTPIYLFEDTATICDGEFFDFRGRKVSQPGFYYDTLQTVSGCDSIFKTLLQVRHTVYATDTVRVCRNDSAMLHGRWVSKEGTYIDTLRTRVTGCDSICRTVVRLLPADTTRLTVTICDNEPYTFNGKQYNTTGTYYARHKNADGCDSTVVLTLQVLPTYLQTQYVEVCHDETFEFRGRVLSAPGVYYDSLLTQTGCDSVFKIVFNKTPIYLFEDTATICDGEFFDFRGRKVSQPGFYYDTLQTVSGCDSIFKTLLQVRHTVYATDTVRVCRNDSAMLHGRWVSKEGTYVDTLRTRVTGCDSICRTVVRLLPADTTRLTVTICDNEPYTFNGKQYNTTGTYYARHKNADGCDSTVVLTLQVLPTYLQTQYVEVCHDETFEFRGRVLSAPGVYYDSLLTQTGCDSVFKIVFNKTPIYLFEDTATICDGEFFDFRGRKVSQPGFYYDTLQTVSGCDSIFKTLLQVRHTVYATDTVRVCRNDSAMLHGRWVSKEGTYIDTLRTRVTGCDSICRTVVRLLPADTTRLTVTICDNEPYTFNGKQYNTTGTYYARHKNADGCDSTVVLTLQVLPTYLQTQYVEVCHDETFEFRGRVLSAPGVYYDSLLTQTGCDSVFKIVFNKTPIYLFEDTATICDGEFFDFRGRKVSQPGFYYDTLQTVSGCDSIFKTLLQVRHTVYATDTVRVCRNDSAMLHGRWVSKEGTYVDTLRTRVTGCDSICRTVVRLLPADTTRLTVTICDNEPYTFNGKQYNTTGTYYARHKNADGCDSTVVLTLQVLPTYLQTQYVEVCHDETFEFRGRVLSAPGVYYDSLLTQTGCDSVFKIVFNKTPIYLFEDTATICDGEFFDFRGRKVSQPGFYYDTLQTVSGCDSIFKTLLQVRHTVYATDTVRVCRNDSAMLHGRWVSKEGTYIDTLRTRVTGCDSICRTVVRLLPADTTRLTVTICDNEPYTFNGKQYNTTGTYYARHKNADGCDSTVVLTLQVLPTYLQTQYVEVCHDETFEFRGRVLSAPGVYYDSLLTQTGCDSVFKIVFNKTPIYLFEDTATICDGEFFDFRGRKVSQPGFYYDTLQTVSGCDSIFKTLLQVRHTVYATDTVRVCRNDSAMLHGRWVSKEGTYVDTLRTRVTGCDSICRTVVRLLPADTTRLTVTICDNEPYTFNGKQYNTTGTYYARHKNADGCDSTVVLTLQVLPTYLQTQYVEVCHDETFEFRGRVLSAPGVYYDSLLTQTGCDSVFKIVFNKTPIYLFEDTATICDGEFFDFRGRKVSQPGFYYDTLQTVSGCDSIYRLLLKVSRTFYQRMDTTICGTYYDFRGKYLYESGTYYDSIKTYSGCDSVYQLNLTIHPTYLYPTYIEQCEGESFTFRGKTYTEPGIYYDSLLTRHGCDSVYMLVYNRTPTYLFETEATVCSNKSYNFRGQQIDKPGVYYDRLETVSGCDSVFKLTLTHNQSYFFSEQKTGNTCDDQTYLFQGRAITQSGVYYDSLQTSCGCDSIYRLEIVLNQSYMFNEVAHICDYERYRFRGKYYSATGVYMDSLVTFAGCDSIYRLELYVSPTHYDTLVDSICAGSSYSFGGRLLHNSGYYTDTLYDPVGNLCTISSLHLTAKPATVLTSVSDVSSCADDREYSIGCKFYGSTPARYSILYDSVAHLYGFEDIIDRHSVDGIVGDIPQYRNHDEYIRPDYYNARLVVDNGVCDAVGEGIPFRLLVKYPSWIIEQNWGDVVATLNERYNGGYMFDSYQWNVNGRNVGDNWPNLYMPELMAGDEVVLYLVRSGESYALPTCPITIEAWSSSNSSDFPVLLSPTSVSRSHARINIRAKASGSYDIYDMMGKHVGSASYQVGDSDMDMPSVSGCYIIVLHAEGNTKSTKVVVY